jgi:hypothetical protein
VELLNTLEMSSWTGFWTGSWTAMLAPEPCIRDAALSHVLNALSMIGARWEGRDSPPSRRMATEDRRHLRRPEQIQKLVISRAISGMRIEYERPA